MAEKTVEGLREAIQDAEMEFMKSVMDHDTPLCTFVARAIVDYFGVTEEDIETLLYWSGAGLPDNHNNFPERKASMLRVCNALWLLLEASRG